MKMDKRTEEYQQREKLMMQIEGVTGPLVTLVWNELDTREMEILRNALIREDAKR